MFFLCGVVCLIVAPHLRWSPEQLVSPQRYQYLSWQAYDKIRMEWFGFLGLAVLPIIFAALAGYFACFWPGKRPARRILDAVLLPAAFGLSLVCGRFYYLNRQRASLLESGADVLYRNVISFVGISSRLGPGFHYCLSGIMLTAIFTWRLVLGNSSLPLTLAQTNCPTCEDAEPWPRLNFLIWVLVGPLFVLSATISVFAVTIPYVISSHLPTYSQSPWFLRTISIVEPAIFLGFVLCTVSRVGRHGVRNSIRLPDPGVFFLALVTPIGIAAFISTGQYIFDRISWVAHNFGNGSPPSIGSYFNFPDAWFLLAFFSAFVEEIVFRGLLQHRFIQKYGLYRGTFLVGVVWAAFHFFSDTHSDESDLEVLWSLAFRIFFCLALGYVFSWLTLRSGSVLPAAFAHTFYNVLVQSGFGPYFYGKGVVRVGLWAVLAYVLFHFWPVQVADEPEGDPAVPEPEVSF